MNGDDEKGGSRACLVVGIDHRSRAAVLVRRIRVRTALAAQKKVLPKASEQTN
jgi:hypothetical protein